MPKSKQTIIRKVLKKIVPTPSEKKKLESLAKRILKLANEEAVKEDAYAIIAGSLTRDTWLPGKMEFDIFILFQPKVKKEKMEKEGLKIGKKVIKKMKGSYRIEYAEHPYVSGNIKGMQIDIVPCYEIDSTENLKSSVDRTPFHVRYIESSLPPKLADEVRLLKKLCSAHDIYGADTKTEGFSGYVCELLTIKYGSFMDVMKAVAGWKPGQVVDIENFYTKNDYAELRKKFKQQPLILIDPTDMNRNAAAAISPKNFYKLKKAARGFLNSPDESMFFKTKIKPIKLSELRKLQKKRQTQFISIDFKAPDVVPDILWPQLRKFADRLDSILRENEFSVMRKAVYSDEDKLAVVLLEMENYRMPSVDKRVGPSVFDTDGSKNFIKKYKSRAINGPFVEGDCWVVEIERGFCTAEEKLKDSLSDSMKTLKAKGIPSHIAKQVSKKFNVSTDVKKIYKIVKRDKGFGVFLRNYFEKGSLA